MGPSNFKGISRDTCKDIYLFLFYFIFFVTKHENMLKLHNSIFLVLKDKLVSLRFI